MLFNFQNISYALGSDQARQINVSGSADRGGVLVIRGPSGAGKSTLLRILSRLQLPTGGEAFLKDVSWLQIPPTAWRARVHYLAQKPAFFDGTVADNLAKPFGTRFLSNKKFDAGLARNLMKELYLAPQIWEQDARTISGGEAARLAFVRALLIEPEVLLLDEPTAALDEKAREAFYCVLSNWLSGSDRAALLVSHTNDYQELNCLSYLDIKSPIEV